MNTAVKSMNSMNPLRPDLQGLSSLNADERVAALADSALSEADAQAVIDELLRSSDLCATWQSLHRCGDYLRSEDLAACDASGAFWQSFAARLEQEPTLLVPKLAKQSNRRLWLRYGMPGAAVAAALMVSWMTLPQLTGSSGNEVVAQRNNDTSTNTSSLAQTVAGTQSGSAAAVMTVSAPASTAPTIPAHAASSTSQLALGSQAPSSASLTAEATPVDARQLRNYLAAHQQFSASALRGPVAVQSASFNIIRTED